jgi:16S rRNA (cytidine1402-2'-O)-methyltransferase
LAKAAGLSHWVVENAKSARGFLRRVHMHTPLKYSLQALHISELPRALHKLGDFPKQGHLLAPMEEELKTLLEPCLLGDDVGLLSEAGMPAVADPGALVVRLAHELDIPVNVFSGPSSLMMALASSGLNGQSFAFVGYLPVTGSERQARIRALESIATTEGQTQVFIETPHRNLALRDALLQTLKPTTRLAAACGLALHDPGRKTTHSGPVSSWRKAPPELDWDLPCVFMLGR